MVYLGGFGVPAGFGVPVQDASFSHSAVNWTKQNSIFSPTASALMTAPGTVHPPSVAKLIGCFSMYQVWVGRSSWVEKY